MENGTAALDASPDGGGPESAAGPGLEELVRLADSLLEEVSAVRRECDQIVESLGTRSEAIATASGDAAARAPMALDDSPYTDLPEGVVPDPRVAALGMALDGSDRATTAEFLVATFGIDDPQPILDEVYPEGAQDLQSKSSKRLFRRR